MLSLFKHQIIGRGDTEQSERDTKTLKIMTDMMHVFTSSFTFKKDLDR